VENSRLMHEERRKTELMAILAHEIRNPLSGILGYSELGASQSEPDSQQLDLFDRIRRNGARLRRLVDNIMELTRNESGVSEWSFHPVNMPQLVREAISTNQLTASSRNIQLKFDDSVACRSVLGNEGRLLQVLNNLLSNAIKFSSSGDDIELRCYPEEVSRSDPAAPPPPTTALEAWVGQERSRQASTFLRVDVTDSGPGMTDENRTRLFEKFAQAGTSQSRAKGVGLGLYISREIIDRHGGSIWVDSQLGVGSTFSFRLPLAPE
jgi:two-component system phosphate regulon sensor histidine kinase PhoR